MGRRVRLHHRTLYRRDPPRSDDGQLQAGRSQGDRRRGCGGARHPDVRAQLARGRQDLDVLALYQSSDAAIAHVKHVFGQFGKEIGEVQKPTGVVVYGNPTEEAKQAFGGGNAVYETPIEGFVR
jgi:hypothetical protein